MADKLRKPIAVKLDIEIFKRLKEVLENYGLAQYMHQVEKEDKLTLEQPKEY